MENTPPRHSHSMVPGGLLVTSYTTRLTLRTVLQMRVETARRNAGSKWNQSAVMPSALVTARSATTWLRGARRLADTPCAPLAAATYQPQHKALTQSHNA